jgi:hypothetical protein
MVSADGNIVTAWVAGASANTSHLLSGTISTISTIDGRVAGGR